MIHNKNSTVIITSTCMLVLLENSKSRMGSYEGAKERLHRPTTASHCFCRDIAGILPCLFKSGVYYL